MKVLLVKPLSDMHVILPPIGLGYLATYLDKEIPDLDLRILDCNRERLTPARFKQYIKEFNPDIIGFTALSLELNSALGFASIAKAALKNVTIIFGGPHASAAPEDILIKPFVDYIFRAEAEVGFSFFLKHFHSNDKLSAPGLGYRLGERIILNEPELIQDLDGISFPGYGKMQFEKYPKMYFMKYFPAAPLISSRGCPFNCTFCAGHRVSGRKWRYRSISNILKEITFLEDRYAVKEIDFWDDNFTLNKSRVEEFCDALNSRAKKIKWWCPNGVHLNTIDKKLLLAMKESGCYAVAFGIESGSEKVRQDMKKDISIRKLREMVEFSRKIGLRTQGFFIIGYPSETKEDILKTIQLSRSLPLLRASFCLFQPIVGSKIYQGLLDSHKLDKGQSAKLSCDFALVSIPTESITNISVIKKLQRKAILRFYLRPKIFIQLLIENLSFSQIKELVGIIRQYIFGR